MGQSQLRRGIRGGPMGEMLFQLTEQPCQDQIEDHSRRGLERARGRKEV